ncbi:MAG: di-trans,poly-cis-decaprenylcistransferase [Chloroflexi bacterium]|nr:di-trans,poly-cis-decaprenylcistransferase [Chloroflexota bacterium]
MADPKITKIPTHIAIIMDGNGRWARQRGLSRLAGHRAGTENVRAIVEACADRGVRILTIYAFSTENWGRPKTEVAGLLRIMEEVIHRETMNLHRNGVQLRYLGELDGLPERLVQAIRDALELTCANSRITLNVAFNYGGRAEILRAVRQMLQEGVSPELVDDALFSRHLYTAGQPDPDMIIRTAGEMRLSNFLIWQSAYAEYYATSVFWPDFNEAELDRALVAYSQRERRFGRL